MKRNQVIRPIVCACEINSLVGVVLRYDYDRASQEFWRPLMEANAKRSKPLIMKPGGIYLSIEPTFVFHKKSRNMKILLRRCFVEQAVFAVPLIPMTVAIRDEPFDTEYLFEADNNIRPSERYVSTETIRVGYTVVVTAVETGQVVVEAKVLDLDLLENGLYRKIVVKSTENKKCDEIRLAYFPSEGVWRVLSEDPFGPGETFSRRSNGYYIQVSHREDWDQMKSEVDGLIKRLSQKPLALKLGHHASPVGILNTYREKDLSLMEAVRRFEAGQS